MTFFSRCEPSQFVGPGRRGVSPRRGRTAGAGGLRQAFLGFAEDFGILVRYAAGLDYYDRGALDRRARP